MKLTWPPDLCFSLMHSLVALWPLRTRRSLLAATRVTYVRTLSCTGNTTHQWSHASPYLCFYSRDVSLGAYTRVLCRLCFMRCSRVCVRVFVFCVCNFLFEIVTIFTLETIRQQVRK